MSKASNAKITSTKNESLNFDIMQVLYFVYTVF